MPPTEQNPGKSPIRVVAGAVIRDGQVLVALRARGGPRGDLWELPGGKVQGTESDAQALRRELEEELGIEVAITGLLGVSDYAYPDLQIRLVGLSCRLLQGEPEAREHAALRWVGIDGLSTLDWAPADVPLLDPLRALLQPV